MDGVAADATIEPVEGAHISVLKGTIAVKAGDRLRLRTGGGGGFGPPAGRDPEAVAADVAAGYISAGHAASVYGVITDSDGAIDVAATETCRAAMG
jgi:N-methylhydantoinase B